MTQHTIRWDAATQTYYCGTTETGRDWRRVGCGHQSPQSAVAHSHNLAQRPTAHELAAMSAKVVRESGVGTVTDIADATPRSAPDASATIPVVVVQEPTGAPLGHEVVEGPGSLRPRSAGATEDRRERFGAEAVVASGGAPHPLPLPADGLTPIPNPSSGSGQLSPSAGVGSRITQSEKAAP